MSPKYSGYHPNYSLPIYQLHRNDKQRMKFLESQTQWSLDFFGTESTDGEIRKSRKPRSHHNEIQRNDKVSKKKKSSCSWYDKYYGKNSFNKLKVVIRKYDLTNVQVIVPDFKKHFASKDPLAIDNPIQESEIRKNAIQKLLQSVQMIDSSNEEEKHEVLKSQTEDDRSECFEIVYLAKKISDIEVSIKEDPLNVTATLLTDHQDSSLNKDENLSSNEMIEQRSIMEILDSNTIESSMDQNITSDILKQKKQEFQKASKTKKKRSKKDQKTKKSQKIRETNIFPVEATPNSSQFTQLYLLESNLMHSYSRKTRLEDPLFVDPLEMTTAKI